MCFFLFLAACWHTKQHTRQHKPYCVLRNRNRKSVLWQQHHTTNKHQQSPPPAENTQYRPHHRRVVVRLTSLERSHNTFTGDIYAPNKSPERWTWTVHRLCVERENRTRRSGVHKKKMCMFEIRKQVQAIDVGYWCGCCYRHPMLARPACLCRCLWCVRQSHVRIISAVHQHTKPFNSRYLRCRLWMSMIDFFCPPCVCKHNAANNANINHRNHHQRPHNVHIH